MKHPVQMIATALFVLLLLTFASALLGAKWLANSPSIFSPVPTIGVLGLFVIAFGGLALLYKRADLDQNVFAFGLPPGTIRATIAIGILIIFLTIPAYLFVELGTLSPSNITPDGKSLTAAPQNLPDGVFAIEVSDGNQSEWLIFSNASATARERLAFQIFTAISTTLAAISAFYFGARTAQFSQSTIDGAKPGSTSMGGPDVGARLADMRVANAALIAELSPMQSALSKLSDLESQNPNSEEIAELRTLAEEIVSVTAPDLLNQLQNLLDQAEQRLQVGARSSAAELSAMRSDVESYHERFRKIASAFEISRDSVEQYLEDAILAAN